MLNSSTDNNENGNHWDQGRNIDGGQEEKNELVTWQEEEGEDEEEDEEELALNGNENKKEELPTKKSAILRGGVSRRALDLLLIKIGFRGYYPLGVFVLLFYANAIGKLISDIVDSGR